MKALLQLNRNGHTPGNETVEKRDSFVNLLISNLIMCLLSGILLVFMEWLFITTKPSFLSASSFVERISVLLVAFFLLAAFLLLCSVPALIISAIFPRKIRIIAHLLALAPAAVLASLGLLLIDNFTYTVLKFGIVDSSGITRSIYLFLWLSLFILADIRMAKFIIHRPTKKSSHKVVGALAIIFTVVPILLSMIFIRVPSSVRGELNSLTSASDLPNIVLFTPDGVNARNMSVYGYERETTPFLDSIKDSLIISTNHFNNAANTSGSITSILTGKYPSETRLLFPPDVLKGKDSLEHLAAILRDLGYYSSQLTIRHYIDASSQNFQHGFNESNGAYLELNSITNYLNTRVPGNSVLFIKEVEGRVLSRLKHIFFIETMQNTFEQITVTQQDFNDLEKVYKALELLDQKNQPVFVHIHWLGSHGDKFYPESTKFSAHIDRDNQESWNKDLYDDAIVDVDSALEVLFRGLEETGELESTLIIISSDHGEKLSTVERLPMIFYLPDSSNRTITTENTQHIDIAPTILELIAQPQPSWMNAGMSMFAEDFSGSLVLAAGTDRAEDKSGIGQWTLKEDYFTPPFYQFDYMTVIDCDRYYRLNLEKFTWSSGVVSSYVGACSEKDYVSKTEIRTYVIDRLIKDGFEFDQSTIPEIP